MASRERFEWTQTKYAAVDHFIDDAKNTIVKCTDINDYLIQNEISPLKHSTKLFDLILRPQLNIAILENILPELREKIFQIDQLRRDEILESAEIQIKYSGYIDRERAIADKLHRLEDIQIENRFDYENILSLSTEARQKLTKINPKTIGQASRITGVSPNDVSVLLVLLGR